MSSLLKTEYLEAIEALATKFFDELVATARELRPDTLVSISRSAPGVTNRRGVALSLLPAPAEDEVTLAIELSDQEGTLWCEATMYIGQRTALNLTSCAWTDESPLVTQVADTAREFLQVGKPHVVRAFRLIIARMQSC